MHPSHADQLPRLNKIEGQINGIKKMIDSRRYCVDILTQVKAVSSAIRKVERNIMSTHIQSCLKEAVANGDQGELDRKIEELMALLEKSA